MTIGSVSSWSIPQAQAEARRLKVLTDQGIDPREQREALKAKSMANQLMAVPAIAIWDEYTNAKKPKWGDRHYQDHLEMVRQGGDLIARGRKTGDSNVKQPGCRQTPVRVRAGQQHLPSGFAVPYRSTKGNSYEFARHSQQAACTCKANSGSVDMHWQLCESKPLSRCPVCCNSIFHDTLHGGVVCPCV